MAEVKRYDRCSVRLKSSVGDGITSVPSMREAEHGQFVLYSDYAALERRLRIRERAMEILWEGVSDCEIGPKQSLEQAVREIDAEQKVGE